ncbi:MAG: DUF6240 domain-containing protein [Lachnospiraceae bacterium]|nr:DUF6240 domain-containing protein [Lachnospiraceae bacterium]
MELNTYDKPASYGSRMRTEKMGFSLDITGKVRENAAYGKEELKSAEEIAQMAGMTDASVQRDYMAVMSNSMSDEDFAELMKDGANPTKIPAGEVVTNLDRIKIKLAEAGITVAGYNDDLSEEDIKAVLGNSINAGKIISDSLAAADLPATGDNVAGIKEAVMMAGNLKPLTDEAKAYMISENPEPTIENVYKAEYCAASSSAASNGVHFDGAATYAGSDYTIAKWDDLKDQVTDVIKEAGIEDEEAALEDAKWLVSHELPLSKETLKAYGEIKKLEVPVKPADLLAAVSVAIEEGKEAKEADLTITKSLYSKASEIADLFANMKDPGDLMKRRQLEEVRLVMTKEANLTLLRKGINIETRSLEQLVEDLKAAEREFYAPLLGNREDTFKDGLSKEAKSEIDPEEAAELDRKIDLFKQTRNVLGEIPALPVRVVAEKAGADDFNLGQIAQEGARIRTAYEKAGEAYEPLMTAPRADMGDSIRKAFANVDDILTDLDMDLNKANRKAVRTLGYANMEINRESVDTIRTATFSVERVISLMTPEKTLSMIREGQNPLNVNIFDLERSLSQESFEESGEKYSRFLLRLERSGNITQDEKQAFIGMYRLFNTIEKQDGKVIGNVLSSGQDLTLDNMLKASRSNRHMNMEYDIDDDFGFLEKIVEKGDSITSQIERVFTQLIDPAPDKDYIAEKQRDIRSAGRNSKDAQELLSFITEPVTVENILTVNAMSGGMGKGFKKLFSQQDPTEDEKQDKRKEKLTKEDALKLAEEFTDRESAAGAYERFLEKAARVAKSETLLAEEYEDVRTLSMLYKQVGFAATLGRNESYEVPVQLEDGWTSIHLTIVHSNDEAGKVKASFESEAYGRVEALFALKSQGVDGFIVSDSRDGVDNLKRIDDKIREGFLAEKMETSNLSYVFSLNRNNDKYFSPIQAEQTSDARLYKIAKAFIGAVQTS